MDQSTSPLGLRCGRPIEAVGCALAPAESPSAGESPRGRWWSTPCVLTHARDGHALAAAGGRPPPERIAHLRTERGIHRRQGGQEGKCWSSLKSLVEPQKLTESEGHQKYLQGVLYSTREARTFKTPRVTSDVNTRDSHEQGAGGGRGLFRVDSGSIRYVLAETLAGIRIARVNFRASDTFASAKVTEVASAVGSCTHAAFSASCPSRPPPLPFASTPCESLTKYSRLQLVSSTPQSVKHAPRRQLNKSAPT
eukprot:1187616-Prorocentrum_minimum.AAC.12